MAYYTAPGVLRDGAMNEKPDNMSSSPDSDADAAPRMPGTHAGQPASGPTPLEAPTSFGRQMAQLIIIPAVIVIISIAVVATLGLLVRTPDSVDDLLARLEQPSGMGRTTVGLQDPRYLDRCRAAQELAIRIPRMTDPAERQRVNTALINTLKQSVDPVQDIELQTFLLLAIGLLGEEGGLDVLMARLESQDMRVVEGAVGGILAWPEVASARQAVPALVRVLNNEGATVRAEAAAALGKLARPDDVQAVEALARAMQVVGTIHRDISWNAGVALAKLGDPRGVRMVTHVLLNREALAKLPEGETGPRASQPMSAAMQDRVMIHTLANVISGEGESMILHMDDEALWNKISELADQDSSREVRRLAGILLERRRGDHP